VTVECVIPNKHHRVVIGTEWSNINELSQCDISMVFVYIGESCDGGVCDPQ